MIPPLIWTPFSLRLRSRLLLLIDASLSFTLQVVITILLCIWHQYHMNMYTFWSFTLLTAFYAALIAALLFEHLVLTLTILFALPLILGNVVFVAIAIIIIIANDADAYIDGSKCDVPPGKRTIEHLHTGDWVIHGGPVFGVMLLLLCGLEFFSQRVIVHQLRLWNAAYQWLYWLYWMLSPLAVMTLYQLIFDVDKLYPNHFTVAERVLILAAVTLIWQIITWFIFTQVATHHQLHPHALPTPHELIEHGELHGHWSYAPTNVPELVVGADVEPACHEIHNGGPRVVEMIDIH